MLVTRPGAVARMIGRREEEAELARLLAGCRRQGPAVAIVTGEAGVGKSRLLREFIAGLPGGTPVVASEAQEGGAARAFALLRDALEAHVAGDGTLPPVVERWRHPLAHLLAPLVSFDDHPDDGHIHGEEELVRAGLAFIGHFVGQGPAVVAFEDLQWGDEASIEVISRLARRDWPILLVGTFRPEEFDRRQPLAYLLAQLERHRPVTHLSVERLTRAELAEFLATVCGQPVSDRVTDRVHRRTGGNPFFVEELLAALGHGRVGRDTRMTVDPASLADASLPWSTGEAVLRRLDAYDPSTRRLLSAAAVLGERFDLELLAGVTGMDLNEVVDLLQPALDNGVVAEQGPDVFAFRHVLVREAILGELLSRDKRAVHNRAFEILVDAGEAVAELAAYHADEAGRREEAAVYAKVAAVPALHGGAPRDGLRLAVRALERFEDDLSLHRLASQAAAKIGQVEEAAEHARQFVSVADAHGDRPETARGYCQLGWTLWLAAESAKAWDALEAAAELADELDPSDQAEVAATRALLLTARGRAPDAVEEAGRAVALAEQAGDRRRRAMAFVTMSMAMVDSPAHQAPEAVAEAAALLRRARAESSAIGDVENEARALHSMLLPDQAAGLDLAESLEVVQAGRDLADRYGLERFDGKLTVLEAYLSVREGDRASALQALSAAQDALLAPQEVVWRERLGGYVDLADGDLDRARMAVASQRDVLTDRSSPEAEFDIAYLEAGIAAQTADAEVALGALDRVARHVPAVCPCVASEWWELMATALDAGADPADVRLRAHAMAPTPMRRHAGLVAHAWGCVLAAEGKDDLAVEELERSLSAPRTGRRAALLADSRRRLAQLLARQGDRAGARAHLESGLALLARWPGLLRDDLESLSRRIGEPDAPAHSLFTPREHQVLQVLAQGHSNSQIAARLFVSSKTVSTHVSNMLAKTGFTSRTQLTSWAIREGLVDEGR